MLRTRTYLMLAAAGLACTSWALPALAQELPFPFQFLAAGPENPGRPAHVSNYWLGLECYPVEAALRSHLKLPEGQGLVVEQVLPDSPAAKAGLKQYDVLLAVGDKSLSAVPDLVAAVDAAKDQEMKLDLIRGGEPLTVAVTPAKRPENQDFLRNLPEPQRDELQRWFNQVMPGEKNGPMAFRMLRPGAVVPPGSQQPLPKDMSITINRSGDEPAKITIKQGDKSWEVTEDKLDSLPPEVRPHVERALGRGAMVWQLPGGGGLRVMEMPPAGPHGHPFPMDQQFRQLEEQFERLQKQMEQLRRSMPQPESQPKPQSKGDAKA